jgi:hypothetical protein
MKDFFIRTAISTLLTFLQKKDLDGSAIRKWGHALRPLRDALNELYPD